MFPEYFRSRWHVARVCFRLSLVEDQTIPDPARCAACLGCRLATDLLSSAQSLEPLCICTSNACFKYRYKPCCCGACVVVVVCVCSLSRCDEISMKNHRHRCGKNYGWRQFEGHRCTLEIDSEDDVKPCDSPGVRSGFTFPEFRRAGPAYGTKSSFCGKYTSKGLRSPVTPALSPRTKTHKPSVGIQR